MAMEASTSSAATSPPEKPVIVRIKRKQFQPPLQSLWLEVSERPAKRLEADFLSISLNENDKQNSGKSVEAKSGRLLFHHLDTITSLETAETTRVNTLLSQLQNEMDDRKHRRGIKSMDPEKRAAASRIAHSQALNQKARFEQVWRSRKGEKKADIMREVFRLYDIVRVDTDIEAIERSDQEEKRRQAEEEENKLLRSFLPLFKEYLPNVVPEVESSTLPSICAEVPADDYVYDLYTLHQHTDQHMADMEDYPMIQVMDEEDLKWGLSSDSEYDSEDSNDENNPLNDYPEEESDSEISSESEADTQTGSEVESKSNASETEENRTISDASGEYNDYSFDEWDDDYWKESVYDDSTEERE